MDSILETGNNKTKCQKFTPENIVETMLDLAGYNTGLIGKTVLENSFGTGNILKAVVEKYIESAIDEGVDKKAISRGLSEDIYGVELDKELYEGCLADLNAIVAKYHLPSVRWKLFNDNALTFKFDTKFDYLIGNPPYISYKEMDKSTRQALQKTYKTCQKGKFDYCYAFIELGISLLKEKGKMVQLIPNNLYKNVFAQELRDLLSEHILCVYDYPNQKLFDKTLTSVSIFLYDAGTTLNYLTYENKTTRKTSRIDRSILKDKWVFEKNNPPLKTPVRFGDRFHASIAIATLCNKAYLIDQHSIVEEKLEKEVIHKAASPKTLRYGKSNHIIFPYRYENGLLSRYSEDEFENLFPNVVRHFKEFEKDLNDRDSDKSAAWFEYGRSQALAHLNKEKILISTIITNKVEAYKIDAETIPYSGIFITLKDNNSTLDDAIDILKSKSFIDYVRRIGISISGQSLRITCKDINDFVYSGGM